MDSIQSKLKVSLMISDFEIDPEKISEALNINSAVIFKKGHPRMAGKGPYTFNLWEFDSGLDEEFDTEKHIKRIFEQIPSLEPVRKVTKSFSASINCVVYFVGDETRPILCLSETCIRKMSDMGLSFGIDYYHR